MSGDTSMAGRHLIADLSGVRADALRDADGLMNLLHRSLTGNGFHVLNRVAHRFDTGGCGFTGMFLLSESHAAIHTYPEHGYLALDIFACGRADPRCVLDALITAVEPTDVQVDQRARMPSCAGKGVAGCPIPPGPPPRSEPRGASPRSLRSRPRPTTSSPEHEGA